MKKSLKLTMLVSIVALFFLAQIPGAQAEELKPGLRIDQTNWQLVDGKICQFAVDFLKEGKWFFTIAPYDCMPQPKIVAEKAKKNAGTVSLGPKGELINWTGGVPFPDLKPSDPDAGIKVAWNFYHSGNWFGDDAATTPVGEPDKDGLFTRYCIDKHGNLITQETSFYGYQWSGRFMLEPIPDVPGYGHLQRSFIIVTRSPRDSAGKTVLYQVPRDPDTPDDMWIYLPSIRRIRRFPTTQRHATQAPTDYNWDDTYGFNGRVTAFTYKFIGVQDEYAWSHYRGHAAPEFKGICMPWNEEAIVSKVYVIEQYSKNPHYSYSIKRWYVDPKSWLAVGFDMYDRKGELWKNLYVASCDMNELERGTSGKAAMMGGSGHAFDLQSGHSTTSLQTGSLGDCLFASQNVGLKPEFFSLPSLRVISRGGSIR